MSADLTDEERAALIFSSGHMNSTVGDWHTIEKHLMTCPTCSATAKTAERIVAARLAAVEALADEWEATDKGGLPPRPTVFANHAAALRAVVRADPTEATT